ncbi:MAG: hypothetical protein IH969_05035 [Candidatus Krumholzibacteriota bacterium]|nr:hypothetical protein [Candidatus Krumholzibacteriota bacterium]
MKYRKLILTAALAAATILALPVPETSARTRGARGGGLPQKAAGQFNVSGQYTGYLNGYVRVSGQEIVITEATKFYFTDEGLVYGAPMLTGQAIYVTGVRRPDGSRTATFVIVQSR